ncbi:hypothetical protein GCM10010305_30510 [Streptomyces termitum]|uniref:Uncharacterized protein n=1 Tax=Streptomyces termitum TaxID=67368 RepID=A0A918T3L6_9ACTN|nr:hypothetical protein GCM10010305_30510 [Streptomyces termitum]
MRSIGRKVPSRIRYAFADAVRTASVRPGARVSRAWRPALRRRHREPIARRWRRSYCVRKRRAELDTSTPDGWTST